MSKEEKFKLYSSSIYGTMVTENNQQACDNIIEIVKLIVKISDMISIEYEYKKEILNKLYDLLDFQIRLLEEDK